MQTIAALDVSRPELIEMPVHIAGSGASIDNAAGGKNLVFKWGTGSWTLQPVNFSTDFTQTGKWETAKLRLSDFAYAQGFWREVPNETSDDYGERDNFMSCVIPANGLPQNYPFANQTQLAAGAALPNGPLNAQTLALSGDNVALMMVSTSEFAANTGFMLRFYFEGRTPSKRAAMLDFTFGEYMLRLHADGAAEIQQTQDFFNYVIVDRFNWADADWVMGRHHQVAVVPHNRNCIEVVTKETWITDLNRGNAILGINKGQRADMRTHVYTLPGKTRYQSDGVTPQITQAGQITLQTNVEFRPFLQISKIVYYNGAPGSATGQAYLYAPPRILEDPASAPFSVSVDVDYNGGSGYYDVYDPTTRKPWQPGAAPIVQFAIALEGLGDVGGPGLGSSATPEFYGWQAYKGALFVFEERNTVTTPVLEVGLDTGDAAEAERGKVHLDNSAYQFEDARAGQLEAFARRGDIPLWVSDTDSGTVLFEGRCEQVTSSEAPHARPRSLQLECVGMADYLLSHTWAANTPDFGVDFADPTQGGWLWTDAARWMFVACGFPESQILIEQEAAYRFRLWTKDENGGSRKGARGSGSNASSAHTGRGGTYWKPQFGKRAYDTIKLLLQDCLGWHFTWDKADHSWHIYKRPHPWAAADANLLLPKFAFYRRKNIAAAQPDGIAAYDHANLEFVTKRPRYTTVRLSTGLEESPFAASWGNNQVVATLQWSLQQVGLGGGASPSDPSWPVQAAAASVTYDNANGYASGEHPNPDKSSPDYLGRLTKLDLPVDLPSRECTEYVGRNLFYSECIGHVAASWRAYWGDPLTANLRKWDVVLLDSGPNYESEKWFIDRIEPQWSRDSVVRASYRATKLRDDAPPPY